ncbi:MAG: hypothetical protein JSS86_05345 [Cyanobacteria bacterium SZAS LIN-2]|nr:hypothetical protein [Cyanobacteria bacterium SZAS LIN-2]
MITDAHSGRLERQPEVHNAGQDDGLQNYRLGTEVRMTNLIFNTADAHLPKMLIADNQGEAPFNPNNLPGKYDQKDIDYATRVFGHDRARALESAGPQALHDMMNALQHAPAEQAQNLKRIFEKNADAVIKFEHDHPKLHQQKI